jgi:hypothetical protein
VFRAETGQSPAKTIENLWLEARFMLDQGRLSVEEIARATGFGDRERMRRSFLHTSDKRRKADATLRTRLPLSKSASSWTVSHRAEHPALGHKERIQKHRTLDDSRRKAHQAERLSVSYFTISA